MLMVFIIMITSTSYSDKDCGLFSFMEAYNPDFVPNMADDKIRYKIGTWANIRMFN